MTEPVLSSGDSIGEYQAVRLLSKGEFGTLYEVKRGRAWFTMRAKISDEQWSVDNAISMMKGLPPHPHVATFLESVSQGKTIYYIFENCNIGTLNEFIIREKPHAEFLQSLMFDMAKGLYHLHRNKLILRNITPDSILLAGGKSRPICKLSHLDMAQYCNCYNQLDSVPNVIDISTLTDRDAYFKNRCTDKYWPPEIKDPGDSFRFGSDIFSLGLVFLSIVVRNIKPDKLLDKDVLYPPTVKKSNGSELPLFLCSDVEIKDLVYSSLKTMPLQDLVYSMLKVKYSKRPHALEVIMALESFVIQDRSVPIVYIALVSLTIVLLVIYVTWKLTFEQ